MTAVQQVSPPFTQAGLVKMEDRKRPSSFDQGDHGPPAKKLATGPNGAGKSHPDADMPWKDDLEVRFHPDFDRHDWLGRPSYMPLVC